MSHELRKGKKVNNNQSYFTSVARNTLPLTNKPEAEGGSDTPLSIKAPFYGYLKLRKATRKGKKSKQGFEVTPGNIYIYIYKYAYGRVIRPTCILALQKSDCGT